MANMFEQADRELVAANVKPAEPVKTKKETQEKKKQEPKTAEPKTAETRKENKSFSADALLAKKMKERRKAKSYGFYLDQDVVDALEELAEKNGTNTSNALNTLLRAILLEK